ncbi:Uncharacterised protein [Mycobacteroides abscessus subsp. abscessus]|nr:Uncharacterised protein [Mycobacteroides abscessus subsp. abscessus]
MSCRLRCAREKSSTPRSRSSWRIADDSACWVMKRSAAAAASVGASAATTN